MHLYFPDERIGPGTNTHWFNAPARNSGPKCRARPRWYNIRGGRFFPDCFDKQAGVPDRSGCSFILWSSCRIRSLHSSGRAHSDDNSGLRIEHNPTVCAGCGVCSLMCSLYHEREVHVSLSRSELVRDPLEAVYSINVCRQCFSPSCYQSCPKKDSALCVDQATGVKYINTDQCDGCGECTQGCPLVPSRVKLNPATNVAFKCDLCRERKNGPICIEYCAQGALALVPVKGEA